MFSMCKYLLLFLTNVGILICWIIWKEIIMKKVNSLDIIEIINRSVENLTLSQDQIETDLLDLGVDSIDFIRIIVDIEEKFSCEIPDSKLLISEINTVTKIMEAVNEAIFNLNTGVLNDR